MSFEEYLSELTDYDIDQLFFRVEQSILQAQGDVREDAPCITCEDFFKTLADKIEEPQRILSRSEVTKLKSHLGLLDTDIPEITLPSVSDGIYGIRDEGEERPDREKESLISREGFFVSVADSMYEPHRLLSVSDIHRVVNAESPVVRGSLFKKYLLSE